MNRRVITGDCLAVLPTFPECSIDAIVTDPPYGLTSKRPSGRSPATRGCAMKGFMGLEWDGRVPGPEYWAACLRVAKPGAHLLAFGGTRTFHRLACAIEDSGWEIRDTIMWVYGSGFPKGHAVLKPAWEPIILARKPLNVTVAENVLRCGTGALNIDGCRVPANGDKLGGGAVSTRAEGWDRPWKQDPKAVEACHERSERNVAKAEQLGRWPANLIHDGSDEVLSCFPSAPGQQGDLDGDEPSRPGKNTYGEYAERRISLARNDSGSAARFFYCAKASKADRAEHNTHPTVKPTALMRYLCRLVTPPDGVVLDPFCGSGSTGKAAVAEGFGFIGIELNQEYVQVAESRIRAAEQKHGTPLLENARESEPV